jgi:hypothetical protein
MKLVLCLIPLLALAAVAIAQICPDTPDGYTRQYRPDGTPANYPPAEEPACYMRVTNEAGSYISCYLCHDYLHRRSLA